MIVMHPAEMARAAIAPHPDRPSTCILHDAPDVRLIAFRLGAGQVVPPHRSKSSVTLTVLAGRGIITGEADGEATEQPCGEGECVAFDPNELHGMRAVDEEFVILAAITPRPGSR